MFDINGLKNLEFFVGLVHDCNVRLEVGDADLRGDGATPCLVEYHCSLRTFVCLVSSPTLQMLRQWSVVCLPLHNLYQLRRRFFLNVKKKYSKWSSPGLVISRQFS